MLVQKWKIPDDGVQGFPYMPMVNGKPAELVIDSRGRRIFYDPYSVENQAVRDYVHREYYQNGFWAGEEETKIEDFHLGVRPNAPVWDGDGGHRDEYFPGWCCQCRPVLFVLNVHGYGYTLTIQNNGRTTMVKSPNKYQWVDNLVPGVATYEVRPTAGGAAVDSGSVEIKGQLRMIKLDYIGNVRDIGGWPVVDDNNVQTGWLKYNRMLRGANLGDPQNDNDLSNDISALANKVGVTMQVDLQENGGVGGSLLKDEYDVAYHCNTRTIGSYGSFFGTGFNTEMKNIFGWYVEHLKASPTNCIYTNCYSGKDRTGCVMALIEALCGCEEDTIIKDWELTCFWAQSTHCTISPRKKSNGAAYRLYAWFGELNAFVGTNYSEKAAAYLKKIGITEAQISDLKSCMVNGYGDMNVSGGVTCNAVGFGEYEAGGEKRYVRRGLTVDYKTGVVKHSGNVNMCCTCYLPVSGHSSITLTVAKKGGVVAWYDTAKKFKSGSSVSADAKNKTIAVPTGAAYAVVNIPYNQKCEIKFN